jgi:large subunit ribosomal protein L24
MAKLKIRAGDKVRVIAGKEKNKSGKVLKTIPVKGRLIVEGLHMIKRAVRPDQKNPQGGFIQREGSVAISNVMLLCPSCDQPARVGYRETGDGERVRICRKCEQDIDKG